MMKIHLPSRTNRRNTACGRDTMAVKMADEPDEGHATCSHCIDDWHFADVNGEAPFGSMTTEEYEDEHGKIMIEHDAMIQDAMKEEARAAVDAERRGGGASLRHLARKWGASRGTIRNYIRGV